MLNDRADHSFCFHLSEPGVCKDTACCIHVTVVYNEAQDGGRTQHKVWKSFFGCLTEVVD